MLQLIGQEGWEAVRVRALAKAAGVSTATFYKHFPNAEECLASTYDAVMAAAVDRSTAAALSGSDYKGSLGAAVAALMEAFAVDDRVARLALIDIFAGGPGPRRRIGVAMGELEKTLSHCLGCAPRAVMAPRHLIAGMAAGSLRVARKTALAGRVHELPDYVLELWEWMLVLPHPEVRSLLGPKAALGPDGRREAEPLPSDFTAGADSDSTDDLPRLRRAAIKLAMKEGVANLDGPRLRAEAGVSKRRFEDRFGSVEECFLDSVEMLIGRAATVAETWSDGQVGWERRTVRFVQALCSQAARNRGHAHLVFLGIFATGRTGLLWREQIVGRIAAALQQTIPACQRPTTITIEASVAAAWHIAQADVAAGRTRELPLVAPLLSYIILAPIVGAPEAASLIRRTNSTEIVTVA
jgi:AcrR family transcriptional regulator